MKYQYIYTTESLFSSVISHHSFKLRAIACNNETQQIEHCHLQISASLKEQNITLGETNNSIDGFGNKTQWGGIAMPHDRFRFVSTGIIKQTTPYCLKENPQPFYLSPTWLTTPKTEMINLASRFDSPLEIMQAVHDLMTYTPCHTTNQTTAIDLWSDRRGVCQDYAHLMIALCRAKGWHSRYVNGFIVGEGATHAWVEVSDGKQWTAYDPTLCVVAEWGYIKIAHGRDVNDCPTNRGHFIGCTTETMTVNVSVSKL
ncbi:MAG: transglutaminase family protein [Bacteroidaceae bacterium]